MNALLAISSFISAIVMIYTSIKESDLKKNFVSNIIKYNELIKLNPDAILKEGLTPPSIGLSSFVSDIKKYAIEDEFSLLITTTNQQYMDFINLYKRKKERYSNIKFISVIVFMLLCGLGSIINGQR